MNVSNDDLIQIFGKDLLSNNMVMPIEIMARVQQLPRYQDGLLSYFYSYIRTTINQFFKDQSDTNQDELEITLHCEVENIIRKATNEANTKFRYASDNDKRLSLIFFTWAAYREIAKNLINVNYILLASKYHKKLVEIETIVKTTGGLTFNEIISNEYKKIGKKGGSQKGINYSEPKQKALDYHDKYLNAKNDKGKHVYSNDKAAREIIAYFESKSVHLGYAERSLSNIISKHRNGQTKG